MCYVHLLSALVTGMVEPPISIYSSNGSLSSAIVEKPKSIVLIPNIDHLHLVNILNKVNYDLKMLACSTTCNLTLHPSQFYVETYHYMVKSGEHVFLTPLVIILNDISVFGHHKLQCRYHFCTDHLL